MIDPKPKYKKQKKAKNNKRNYELRQCAFCGEWHICETHEVYGGRFRQDSIKYGYQVPLCNRCHSRVTENKDDTLKAQKEWKEYFQRQREAYLIIEEGFMPEDARDIWMKEMGRNYL